MTRNERDAATRANVLLLQGYVEAWLTLHGGTALPASWVVTPTGIGADLDVDWPVNPWTTKPMSAGTGAGDFNYVTSRPAYSLSGACSDGSRFTVSGRAAPGTAPNAWAQVRALWQDELVRRSIDRLVRADTNRCSPQWSAAGLADGALLALFMGPGLAGQSIHRQRHE